MNNGTHRNGNGTATAVRRNSPAANRSNGNGARPHSSESSSAPASVEQSSPPNSVEALHWDALAPRATEALAQPLDPELVSQRQGRGGRRFDYIEGHTAIDQANRIFGFGGWGYELVGDVTLRPIEQTDPRTGEVTSTAAYSATVRVTVPGAPARTDVGFQPVSDESPDGHETAFKGAVTDALKRALRSFGDRFGNGLYTGSSPARAADPPTTARNSRSPEPSSQPRQQRSAPEREHQSAERRAPARQVVEPARDSAPQPGTDDAQILRNQLIELSVQQGFSERQLRDAVEARTGRPLDELGPAELNPLIASAAEKLEQRRAAELS